MLAPYLLKRGTPRGLRQLTLSAGVGTDAERAAALTGDGLPLGSGLSVYPAANAAIVDATLNGDFETDTTGWTNNAAGGVISRITTDAAFGAACLQTVNDGTGANQGPVTDALTGLTAGNVYTVGKKIRSVSGATAIRVQIEWYTVLDVSISTSESDVTLTTAWQKFILTATAPALGVHAKIRVINTAATAATYNIDGVQIDNGRVALPFDPANTRVAGTITIPTTGLFTEVQGWVMFGLVAGASLVNLPINSFAVDWREPAAGNLLAFYRNLSTRWDFLGIRNGTTSTRVTLTDSFDPGDERRGFCAWTNTLLSAAVDAVSSGTISTQTRLGAAGGVALETSLGIGHSIDVAGQFSAAFPWTLIGKGVPTQDDVSRGFSWPDTPMLAQIAMLSYGAKPTCLVSCRDSTAILLPAYFRN